VTELVPQMHAAIAADTERIAELCDAHGSVAVPDCPGWDIARLGGHIGRVQRMVVGVLTNPSDGFAPPDTQEKPPGNLSEIGDYVRRGLASLMGELTVRDSSSPCWNFLNEPMTAYFWSRRMAHEISVHRHDAEVAVGASWSAPAPLAVDGVDEYFVMARERLLAARNMTSLGGTLHLHATDIEGEWMVSISDGVVNIGHGHGKGDAAIRGAASDLLLGLWGRISLATSDRYERFGSADVVSALSTLGGT
jgi:uncharacterized protein (TIGR03083 family)